MTWYPYLDMVRNRMEVLLSGLRIGLVIVSFLYFRGDLGVDTSEVALFWLGISSIIIAFLYQFVEVGKHIWSIAAQQENPRKLQVSRLFCSKCFPIVVNVENMMP